MSFDHIGFAIFIIEFTNRTSNSILRESNSKFKILKFNLLMVYKKILYMIVFLIFLCFKEITK